MAKGRKAAGTAAPDPDSIRRSVIGIQGFLVGGKIML